MTGRRTVQITDRQWQRLGADHFDLRMIALVRDIYPESFVDVPDEELRRSITGLLPIASAYGLEDERSAATFILLTWLFGDDVDQRVPVVANVLNDPSISAAGKAGMLRNFMADVFALIDSDRDHAGQGVAP